MEPDGCHRNKPEFLATVAGITPSASGFAQVRFAPALGPLITVEAQMPPARGMIQVKLNQTGAGIAGRILTPEPVGSVTGRLARANRNTQARRPCHYRRWRSVWFRGINRQPWRLVESLTIRWGEKADDSSAAALAKVDGRVRGLRLSRRISVLGITRIAF